jgi:magnesium chelatase subunit D
MLLAHYVRRDRVALMTFNEKGIEMKLHPSRNAEKITSVLNRIKVDYGTPLSETLCELEKYLGTYCLKHPDETVHTVLITDGRATVSMDPAMDPSEEALGIASRIDLPNVEWIVIDTGTGYTKNDVPPKLALVLGGRYFLLEDLQPDGPDGA